MNKISLILAPLLILFTSCSSYFMGGQYEHHEGWARVEDSVVGSECEIISVDDQPAKRQKHGQMVTVIPFVVIPEGEHILTIKSFETEKNNRVDDISEIAISVKKNARYRLMKVNGKPTLIDLSEEQ